MFFSGFMVSGYTFESLIHFELTCVYVAIVFTSVFTEETVLSPSVYSGVLCHKRTIYDSPPSL